MSALVSVLLVVVVRGRKEIEKESQSHGQS